MFCKVFIELGVHPQSPTEAKLISGKAFEGVVMAYAEKLPCEAVMAIAINKIILDINHRNKCDRRNT